MHNSLKALAAASIVLLSGGAAHAVPAFSNPTFSSTATTTTFAYNQPITGWTDASGAGSATGIAAADPTYHWDNGIAPNGETNVAFLQNETAALQQTVSGFVIGNTYQIMVVADARNLTGPVALSIGVNGMEIGAQVLSPSPVSSVDPYGVYATPWATYASATFTATSAVALIQLQNAGIVGSSNFDDVTIDLGSASIADVTAVPEPASLLLALIGLGVVLPARRLAGAARRG